MSAKPKQEQEEDPDNYFDEHMVTLNGFNFCVRHGLEYCGLCINDYRSMNNAMVEDLLEEKLTEEELELHFDDSDREPFSVMNEWTPLGPGVPGCIAHRKVGCLKCFNWGEKIIASIKG